MAEITIRSARSGDEKLILTLLRELAEYEMLVPAFQMTETSIARDFLGRLPVCRCDLAYVGTEPVGIATWYWTYSSFRSVRGVYLEDLYVRESQRGHGFGKALLAHLAKTALAEGGAYVQWAVLDWNAPSIAFYDGIGAKPVKGWTVYQLDGKPLSSLATP